MILLELFWTFFKIGLFTIGGGYAMLPLIQAETLAHGWLSPERMIDFIAVSESTPGPFAVNIATFVGMETCGIPGALCATAGVVLPSFIIILIVAKCFDRYRKSRVVGGCMSGMKPAVVGLIGAAVLSVGGTVFFPAGVSFAALTDTAFIVSALIFAAALVMAFRKVHPIIIICLCAAAGIAAGYALDLA